MLKIYLKINSQDKCVAHKTVDDKKCTILWYVDDNKLSNVDSKVNDDILGKPKVNFRDLSIQLNRNMEFLKTDTTFQPNGYVSIGM